MKLINFYYKKDDFTDSSKYKEDFKEKQGLVSMHIAGGVPFVLN